MGSIDYLQAIKPDTAKLRKLIENSLLADWIVRIEIEAGESETQHWQQWNNPFFAINSAEPVLNAIADCYQQNPDYAIRINAEKIHPQTRILFVAYNPQVTNTREEIKSQASPYSDKQNYYVSNDMRTTARR